MEKLFCDLDGVLVDFEKGAIDIINDKLSNIDRLRPNTKILAQKVRDKYGNSIDHDDFKSEDKIINKLMYSLINGHQSFFLNLDWTSDGKELWSGIKKYDTWILSSPIGESAINQKIQWCIKNLNISPAKVIIVKDKWKYAHPDYYLIDDRSKILDPWINAGGKGILYKNAKKTLEELNLILNDNSN